MSCSAILLMGGQSLRFAPAQSKLQAILGDKPLYQWALDTFKNSGLFTEIIAVGIDIPAGKTRQESSYLGIQAARTKNVMIHDGARPFVSQEILKQHIEALEEHSAINTCIPAVDTINVVEGTNVIEIPDRKKLGQGQTPQSFHRDLILEAHEKTALIDATDDCRLVLDLGHDVFVIQGEPKNFKVTTPLDLAFAAHTLYSEGI